MCRELLVTSKHHGFVQGFVHFADIVGAVKAREAIHGRLFAGITVQALFVDEDAFAAAAKS